jgi:hypothetical protein
MIEWLAAGYALGALSVVAMLGWVLAFEKMRPQTMGLTPARKAGIRRGFKLLVFPAAGVAVANAGFWASELLTHSGYDPTLANAMGLMLGASAGGVAKTQSWVDAPPQPGVLP